MSKAKDQRPKHPGLPDKAPSRGRSGTILPTVGRVLWLYPKQWKEGDQPLAAQIAYVHSDRLINIGYLDKNGVGRNATSVPLVQHGDDDPDEGVMHVRWMPFQVGQAQAQQAPAGPKLHVEAGADAAPAEPPAAGKPEEPAGGDAA